MFQIKFYINFFGMIQLAIQAEVMKPVTPAVQAEEIKLV
jgi:hypothetical protein